VVENFRDCSSFPDSVAWPLDHFLLLTAFCCGLLQDCKPWRRGNLRRSARCSRPRYSFLFQTLKSSSVVLEKGKIKNSSSIFVGSWPRYLLLQQRLSTLCQAQLARSRDIFCHTMTSREHTGLGPVVYNIKLLCTDRRCVCRPVFDMLQHLPGIHDTSHLLFLANQNILIFFSSGLFLRCKLQEKYSSSWSTNRSCVYWRSWSLVGGSSAGRGFASPCRADILWGCNYARARIATRSSDCCVSSSTQQRLSCSWLLLASAARLRIDLQVWSWLSSSTNSSWCRTSSRVLIEFLKSLNVFAIESLAEALGVAVKLVRHEPR